MRLYYVDKNFAYLPDLPLGRPGNTAPFEEMSQRWRAVGNTVANLTGPKFESLTYRSRDKRVTARPTGQFDY